MLDVKIKEIKNMRIPLLCMQCKEKTLFYPATLQDNGLYELKCKNGHESIISLQEQKFEILFDLAANAILDGYYREAVSSFTSSLERFYEFYIKVIAIKHNVSEEVYLKSWKSIKNQSERQLGAYILLYTIEKDKDPPLLHNKKIEFRNEVIHKGKIPSKENAISYGEAVLNVISPVLHDLKTNENDHVMTVVSRHNRDRNKKIKDAKFMSTMSIATTLSIATALSEPQQTLKDTMNRYTRSRFHFGC